MQATPLTRKDIQVVGVRSPVIEAGPQTAEEAVVFVHGNPGSSQDWEELVPSVGTFVRAVAFDMPGFGQADKPVDFDYTAQGYAHHLGAMLTELGIHRAHLVLHDWGGPWRLIWASQHPDAFASLTSSMQRCCWTIAGTGSPGSGARRSWESCFRLLPIVPSSVCY